MTKFRCEPQGGLFLRLTLIEDGKSLLEKVDQEEESCVSCIT